MESSRKFVVGTPEQLDSRTGDTLYEFRCDEAKEGLEWFGISFDMNYVADSTNLLVRLEENQESEVRAFGGVREYEIGNSGVSDSSLDIASRALWESALTTYVRCFHGGKRRWLDQSAFEGQPEHVLRWHQYFKDTRDKHVAHSANPFELGNFGVRLSGQGTENVRVVGGGFVHLYRANDAVQTIKMLNWLAKYVSQLAVTKQSEASKKVIRRAKEMSKEQLNGLPILGLSPEDGFEAAGKDRR